MTETSQEPPLGDHCARFSARPPGRFPRGTGGLASCARPLLFPTPAGPRDAPPLPQACPPPELTRQVVSQAVPAARQRLELATRRVPRSLPCHPGGKHRRDMRVCVSSYRKIPSLRLAAGPSQRPSHGSAGQTPRAGWPDSSQPSSSSDKKHLPADRGCWVGTGSDSPGFRFLFLVCQGPGCAMVFSLCFCPFEPGAWLCDGV